MHGSRGRRRRLAKARRAGTITTTVVVLERSAYGVIQYKDKPFTYRRTVTGRTNFAGSVPADAVIIEDLSMLTNRQLSDRLKALQGKRR